MSLLIAHNPRDRKSRLGALRWAAKKGYYELARQILEKWPATAAKTEDGELSPAQEAIRAGHARIALLILAIDRSDVWENQRLWRDAAWKAQDELFEQVIDLKMADSESNALAIAIANGHESIVTMLLNKRPELVDARALHCAAATGDTKIIDQLLDLQPKLIGRRNSKGCAALHIAAQGCRSEAFFRLQRGSDRRSEL